MAIVQTFGTASGPDCLRDVIKKYGTRVKVYCALKTFLSKELGNEVMKIYLVLNFIFQYSRLLHHHPLLLWHFLILHQERY